MKNSRKNGKNQLPVQKTTLLNFFSRTTSAAVTTKSDVNSPTCSVIAVDEQKYLKCPACSVEMLETKLNVHLDEYCTSSPSKNQTELKTVEEAEVVVISEHTSTVSSTSKTDISTATETTTLIQERWLLSTPSKDKSNDICQVFSTSKKNNIRRANIEAENFIQISRTTPRKTRSFHFERRTSSTEKNNVAKRLFGSQETGSSPSKPKYETPYYLENFKLFLGASLHDKLNRELFNEEDLAFVDTFHKLSLPAQKLYVRLFSRKWDWHRANRLDYEEIGFDLQPILVELHRVKFVICDEELEDVEDALRLLSLPEIKLLCKDVKLPQNSKNLSVKTLLDFCRTQRSISGATSISKVVFKKARQIVSPCYKLAALPKRTFSRMLMLSLLHKCFDEEEDKGKQHILVTQLMVSMGRMMYPEYEIIRTRRIFEDRQQLINFEEAIHLDAQLREALEQQGWSTAIELGDIAARLLEKYLENSSWDLSLPMFLRKFTSGSIYAYCLWKRVEAYQRLRRYKEAVDQLKFLIEQDVYLLYLRGKWYERLALNLDQHLKDYEQTLQVIRNGLSDPWVSPSHKLALSLRAKKLCESARAKNLRSLLNDLPLAAAPDPPTVTITGRSLPRDLPGYKSMFIRGDSQATPEDGDVTLCSVEELVLDYYKQQGYTEGMHGEGSTIKTLVGIFFWDVLYESDIPDTFLSPYQPLPLDLGSDEFYQARKSLIDERLDSIRKWTPEEMLDFLTKIWDRHQGVASAVSWNRFRSSEHVYSLVKSFTREALAAVFGRMLINYAHCRAGFPDLIVWDPIKTICRVVEVKGPNDRLSNKQILWLDFLNSAGVNAEVCYVKAVGTKRMGTNNGPIQTKTPVKNLDSKEDETPPTKKPVKRRRTGKAKKVANNDDDFV